MIGELCVLYALAGAGCAAVLAAGAGDAAMLFLAWPLYAPLASRQASGRARAPDLVALQRRLQDRLERIDALAARGVTAEALAALAALKNRTTRELEELRQVLDRLEIARLAAEDDFASVLEAAARLEVDQLDDNPDDPYRR
jgi:hypothetical protein